MGLAGHLAGSLQANRIVVMKIYGVRLLTKSSMCIYIFFFLSLFFFLEGEGCLFVCLFVSPLLLFFLFEFLSVIEERTVV